MECRLHLTRDGDVLVVGIAGHLTSAHAADLLAACSGAGGPVRVDLSDVVAADPIAIDVLRRVRDAGATLVGVPRYMQFTLDSFPGAEGS